MARCIITLELISVTEVIILFSPCYTHLNVKPSTRNYKALFGMLDHMSTRFNANLTLKPSTRNYGELLDTLDHTSARFNSNRKWFLHSLAVFASGQVLGIICKTTHLLSLHSLSSRTEGKFSRLQKHKPFLPDTAEANIYFAQVGLSIEAK